MNKNKFFILFLSILLIVTLGGCESKAKVEKVNVPPKSDLFGKITVCSEGNHLRAMQKAGEDFKKLNPNVEIQFVDIDNCKSYNKTTGVFSLNSETPDLFSIKNDYIPMLVNKFPDGFEDISGDINSIRNGFFPWQISQATVNGRIYAFPWEVVPVAVFYRTDVFSNANIHIEDIKTWYDYIEAGKLILKSSAGNIKMLPVDENGDDTLYREMLNQLGTGYFDKDGNPVLNSDKSITAMSMIKKMSDAGITLNYSGIDALNSAIRNGTVATLPYGSFYEEIIKANAPDLKGKWGVIKFPTFEPGGNSDVSIQGSSIMVTKVSQNRKVAIEFAKFAVTDNDSLIDSFKKYGLIPAYSQSLKDPIFDKSDEYFSNQKIWRMFTDIVRNSKENNFTVNSIETEKNVIKAQSDILSKKEDIQSVLDRLQRDIQSKFGK